MRTTLRLPSKLSFLTLFLSLTFISTQGQTTFEKVYTILQTNCGTTTCHAGASAVGFDVSLGESAFHSSISGASTVNAMATSKGNKLVDPGHPYNSFLLRKIGYDFDNYFNLEGSEYEAVHAAGAGLVDHEIELIRQWIQFGAKFGADEVDSDVVYRYYTEGGIEMEEPLPMPDPTEGFQVRMGPIFLADGSSAEREYLSKYDPHIPGDIEVTRIVGNMNWESHHFLLFQFDDLAAAAAEVDGLRRVNIFTGVTPFDGNKEFTAAWQYNRDFVLPEKTAYFWDENTILDLDYHIFNYHIDTILAANFYMNVYFEPAGSGNDEMKAELWNNAALLLFPGPSTQRSDHTFGGSRNIWMLSSHTHKYGTDFDIYEKVGGSRGDQIYEGFYNEDYTANNGFYDWEHPAIRYFDPLYTIDGSQGLEIETQYYVLGSAPVTFGLTVNDEMMLMTYLYTDALPSVSNDADLNVEENTYSIAPNPFKDSAYLTYKVENTSEVQIELVNILGERMAVVANQNQAPGVYRVQINAEHKDLTAGVYFVNLNIGDKRHSEKVLIID